MNPFVFLFRTFMLFIVLFTGQAHAALLKFNYTGPTFTSASGPFNVTDRITGFVQFDSSLLDLNGTGSIYTSANSVNSGIGWQFEDGVNFFSNILNNNNYTLQISFNALIPTFWNIDTTWGVTYGGDIFVHSSAVRYESYAPGGFATTYFYPTSSHWSLANDVPAPFTALASSLCLLFLSRKRFKSA